MKKLLLCLMALLLGVPLAQSKVFYIDLIDGQTADNLLLWLWNDSDPNPIKPNLTTTNDDKLGWGKTECKLSTISDYVKPVYKAETSFDKISDSKWKVKIPEEISKIIFRNVTDTNKKLGDGTTTEFPIENEATYTVSTSSVKVENGTTEPTYTKYYLQGWGNNASTTELSTTDGIKYTLPEAMLLNATTGYKVHNLSSWYGFTCIGEGKNYFKNEKNDQTDAGGTFIVLPEYAGKQFNVTYTVDGNKIDISLADAPLQDVAPRLISVADNGSTTLIAELGSSDNNLYGNTNVTFQSGVKYIAYYRASGTDYYLGYDKLTNANTFATQATEDSKNFFVLKPEYVDKTVTFELNKSEGTIKIIYTEPDPDPSTITDFWICGDDFGWKNETNPTEGEYKKDENKFVKNGNIWTKTVSLTGGKYWGIMDSLGSQWQQKKRDNDYEPWSELLSNHKLVKINLAMKAAATGKYDLTIKLDTDGTPLLTIAKHVDGPTFYVVGDQFAVEKDENGKITNWLTSDKYKLNQEGSTWTDTIHVNKGFNWAIRDNSGKQWAITADNAGEWAENIDNQALVANDGGNKAGGTGQYKLTLTVDSDNTPSISITKLDRPAPAQGTVFFVFSQTCPEGLTPDNIRCYTYDNSTASPDPGKDEVNGVWPGETMEEDYIVADLLNEGVTDINGLIRVFKYTNRHPEKQKMVIFNNNNNGEQTRNLLYVNYGVYSFNNELTPTNILMYGANGTSRLRRYANTEDPMTAKYLYVPIEEFGFNSKDPNSVNDAKKTTAYIHITIPEKEACNKTGKDWVITGIKGTSKMILAEYAGQYFWRFPSASIEPGTKLDIEINIMDGAGEDKKWKNICKHGDANQTEANSKVTDHYNCGGPANRIMHIPADAGEDYIYKRGIVYYRYKSNHDPLTTTIYNLTKPKALYLVDAANDKEYLATRFDENGVFYWDGDDQKISKSEGAHKFYFRAEFNSETSPTLYYRHNVPNVDGVLNTRRLMHYEIDHIDVVPTEKFFDVPQNETFDTYRVRLSWSDQDFWTNPVDEDPIISMDAKDFVAHTLDSEKSEVIGVILHGAFKDENMLWMTEASIEMTPEYVAMSPKTAAAHKPVAIKCTNQDHPKAHLTWADGWTVDNSEDAKLQKAQVNVRAYVAGKYNVSIKNPASALFPMQVFSQEITVKPTTQALGLMIHDHPITTITDGVCTLNYNPAQLYEKKENGEYDKTKPLPNKPHEGQPQGIVWGPTKAFIYCANVDWTEQEKIEIWYSVNGAANAALDLDKGPVCRPTAEDAVPASKIDGSYQKYDQNHSLNLFDLIDKGQSAQIIVKQNGIESEPLTLNFSNTSTAVDQIEEAEDVEPIYYTLQGVRVENPDKGIYIRIRGKKADKVMF